ncbi:MAG: aspartate aminotransferase family protein [Candidatus Sericytochromatia bacterium]|nr:aspartate aminotransferase family protein [Candidatus Sericytochromatia bacterium]
MSEPLTPAELLAKRQQYMAPTLAHYYERPMNLVRGEMQHLFDSDGRRYLDFFAGICTVSVGHSNPQVNQRVIDQIGRLQHTSTVFLTEPMVNLAERLAQITPGRLQMSIMTNSGTEANETAVLLAKRFTGRNEIVALKHAYHGRSWLAASLTAIASYRVDPVPVPGISFAENPYCYRCPYGKVPSACALECAKDVENVIKTQTTGAPATFVAETMQGVGGIITPPPDYFKVVREITQRHGMVFHIDEVQAGFGRTGRWFGIEHYGVEPDIITMAKGMGNGFAIGGCITTPEIAESLKAGTINTFGGNPISATASLATIDYIEQAHLMAQARELGDYLLDALRGLQEEFPLIGDVRGKGLMLGVELVEDPRSKLPALVETKRVLELMKDDGVIVGRGGLHGNVLRLQPPMVITRGDCDRLVTSMRRAIATVSEQLASKTG